MMADWIAPRMTWGPVLAAARRGDLPLIRIGATPASVAKEFGGRQPVYLATPYSREVIDDMGEWCHLRSQAMGRAAARAAEALRQAGVSAFAPIALSDAMVRASSVFVANAYGRVRFAASADPLDDAAWARWLFRDAGPVARGARAPRPWSGPAPAQRHRRRAALCAAARSAGVSVCGVLR